MDNASGKVTDEWFMQLSHKYEVERLELKQKVSTLREKLSSMNSRHRDRDAFIAAIRKFIEMGRLTAPLLGELIGHIGVHETEGTCKNRTQRIAIYYRFVGYLDIPLAPDCELYKAETRQGFAVEYLPKAISA